MLVKCASSVPLDDTLGKGSKETAGEAGALAQRQHERREVIQPPLLQCCDLGDGDRAPETSGDIGSG